MWVRMNFSDTKLLGTCERKRKVKAGEPAKDSVKGNEGRRVRKSLGTIAPNNEEA